MGTSKREDALRRQLQILARDHRKVSAILKREEQKREEQKRVSQMANAARSLRAAVTTRTADITAAQEEPRVVAAGSSPGPPGSRITVPAKKPVASPGKGRELSLAEVIRMVLSQNQQVILEVKFLSYIVFGLGLLLGILFVIALVK